MVIKLKIGVFIEPFLEILVGEGERRMPSGFLLWGHIGKTHCECNYYTYSIPLSMAFYSIKDDP
jgi:hypothetical protein